MGGRVYLPVLHTETTFSSANVPANESVIRRSVPLYWGLITSWSACTTKQPAGVNAYATKRDVARKMENLEDRIKEEKCSGKLQLRCLH